jgi:N-acetylglucosamine-6-phosphate deacetylase
MMYAIINANILCDNDEIVNGHCLVINSGFIQEICSASDVPTEAFCIDAEGCTLLPGFVDLQVNGGGGFLFNDDPSVETIRKIAEAHYQFGTTSLLPTLISDDLGKVEQGISAVNEAILAKVPGIVGIHIEGPFLNSDRNGIHDRTKIRALDDTGLATLKPLVSGKMLVTLAPECIPDEHLRTLVDQGIVVCAGHTNANFDELMAAFENGVSGVTHLYNAMNPITSRSPGGVGAALFNQDCWCCVIVDGAHVDPVTITLAMRAKGRPDKFVLVTDAMPTVGQVEGSFILNGEIIVAVGDACFNPERALAGSNLNMAKTVKNARDLLNLDLATASRMASINPAQLIGLDQEFGFLRPGMKANLVAINEDGVVQRTWIDGEVVWAAT